jgi:microtubule-associated protein, RP/EB family
MEENLFLSRHDLLNWLNHLLDTSYSKVEELSTGVAFCLVFHNVYPDALHKSKILFSAKHDYESLKNFKLLQSGFVKKKIGKTFDAEKLIRGKYIDNFQFLQWVKWFHDSHTRKGSIERTKAVEEEEEEEEEEEVVVTGGSLSVKRPNVDDDARKGGGKISSGEHTAGSTDSKITMKKESTRTQRSGGQPRQAEITKRKMQILEETIEALEEERDFYFQKLRDVEILIQTCKWQNHPLLEELRDAL